MIDFECTGEELDIALQIAERAYKANPAFTVLGTSMDIVATHMNGCPLRLRELLEADDLNFAHDVAGIARHIDRTTGKLTNCFLPRFADLIRDAGTPS